MEEGDEEQHQGAVPGQDEGPAASEEIEAAVSVFHLDNLTRLAGFVCQEEVTADQVGKDLLQANTEPQPRGSAEEGENGEIETQVRQDHHAGNEIKAPRRQAFPGEPAPPGSSPTPISVAIFKSCQEAGVNSPYIRGFPSISWVINRTKGGLRPAVGRVISLQIRRKSDKLNEKNPAPPPCRPGRRPSDPPDENLSHFCPPGR